MTHADCPHPEDQIEDSISHLGDPEWAYCYACSCVLHREDGHWVAQQTGITKASYRYG